MYGAIKERSIGTTAALLTHYPMITSHHGRRQVSAGGTLHVAASPSVPGTETARVAYAAFPSGNEHTLIESL
jgi:hypothetical protein